MPSEPEDPRARQLEALRRYMAQLGTEGDQVAAGAGKASERRRPSLPWLLLTGLLVAVALVGGVFVGAAAWSDDRPARGGAGAAASPPSQRTPTPTSAEAPVATLACKTAVDRANAMLASAVKLRGDLAEHDRILRDPSSRGLSASQLLERLAPLQQAASGESARFDRELEAYRQIVDQCDVRAP
jgi:hypothetical protein